MGRLILCHEIYAKEPYLFKETKTKVYTIEELCYYIYNNIYIITEEVFDLELFMWLEQQLKMKELKEKLLQIQQTEHTLKDIVVVLLCNCDYYNEQEIRVLLEIIDKLEHLTMQERRKIKADNYLLSKQYGNALREYEIMLEEENARELTTEQYGDILHNIAVIHTQLNSYSEASIIFKEAYCRNQREETLIHYLMSLKMERKEDLLEEEALHFGVKEEVLKEIHAQWISKQEEARYIKDYEAIEKLTQLKAEGLVSEYYENMDKLLNQWKKDYRKKLGR